MPSDRPLEFFFDRSLGRKSAQMLRANGWIVHLIADHYPDDGNTSPTSNGRIARKWP